MDIYLYGASGHGKVIMDSLYASGVKVKAFIDDNTAVETLAGYPVLHNADGLSPVIVAIGDNSIRKKIVEQLHCDFGTAIHPSSVISPSAKIGEGTVIMAGVVVNADVVIGKHCIINTGATVDHDCVIDDYCHIAPGVHLSGGVRVGEGSWIGIGSSVCQYLNLGAWNMIGAGSVVVEDIPEDHITAFGNPCKIRH